MPAKRPLVNLEGIPGELSSPDVESLVSIAFAALPTLSASDRAMCWCSDHPFGPSVLFWNGSAWIAGSFSEIPVRSGIDATLATSQTAMTTQATAASTLRAYPWLVKRRLVIRAVRCEVTTLAASSTFRVGLYADNGQAYPGSLISGSDVAPMDGSTTGVKLNTFASDITLNPGLYWVVFNSNVSVTLRAISTAAILNVLGLNPAGGVTTTYTGWSAGFSYAAMPSTFPGAAIPTSTAAPVAMFRTV